MRRIHWLLWISVLMACASAWPQPIQRKPYDPQKRLDWVKLPWTGDSRPYQKIQKETYTLYKKGGVTKAVLDDYWKAFSRSYHSGTGSDPKPGFRWAYAARLYAWGSPDKKKQEELIDALNALEWVPAPRIYEYARLRFLTDVARNRYERGYKNLAKRLLARNPKDPEHLYIKGQLISMLNPRDYPAEKQLGLKLCRELLRLDPKRAVPPVYSKIARLYYSSFLGNKSNAEANRAIYWYRKYINAAPSNASFRDDAIGWIKIIKMLQKQYKANKTLKP